MRIDLHTHSVVSDGTQTPTELVHAARAAGLDVLALTDHDTAGGWDEAALAAQEVGVTLVRGMEISTSLRGRGVHLLAYLPDPTHPGLAAELAQVLDGRGSRAPAIIAALQRLGIDLTPDDIAAEVPGRPHVADALVRKGVVASRDEAFARYLNPGRPAYVDRYAAPLATAITLVGQAGGVAVIAHPWGRGRRDSLPATELERLARLGLAGIEVDHQDHDDAARSELRGIARDLDLVATGSSDHHGLGKVDHGLGVNTTAVDQYERLLDRAAAAAAASGRTTPEVVAP
ncbi:PHP domain-containing protein [Nocardioides rubriscoriae]|uniref:PHP domain-containing protein n=1 Tax=Nocardioides rubriscoriae TaxID=642762 RepID=UPI0011DF94B7|nr:PHP domain-containing protein [Nocardioides rubriscoriae]